MNVIRSESLIIDGAGGTITKECATIGAHGIIVSARSVTTVARFRLLDSRSGTTQTETLMTAEVGQPSFQVPAAASFPITQGQLVIIPDGVNSFQLDINYLDEPPEIPWGRWLAFIKQVTLAASATSVPFTNLEIGRVARVSGLLKTTRPGSIILSYGNTDDFIFNVGNFLNVAGATGGVSSTLTQLTHPWSTWTLSNNDAVNANTITCIVWVDSAMR